MEQTSTDWFTTAGVGVISMITGIFIKGFISKASKLDEKQITDLQNSITELSKEVKSLSNSIQELHTSDAVQKEKHKVLNQRLEKLEK